MTAYLLIRRDPCYRSESFAKGLRAVGYEVSAIVPRHPRSTDVLVIWNRYGRYEVLAKQFENAGARVLVAENGYLGRDWRNEHWYALSQSYHNGAGHWVNGGSERWDGLGVSIAPWRDDGDEIVVLATRHIGPENVKEPHRWSDTIARQCKARIRAHPGERPCTPLEDDLRRAKCVITWGSGAALKCLLMGIPVQYGFKKWIGAPGATPIGGSGKGDRLAMFRRMAWAMWNTEEISSGEPFKWLLR